MRLSVCQAAALQGCGVAQLALFNARAYPSCLALLRLVHVFDGWPAHTSASLLNCTCVFGGCWRLLLCPPASACVQFALFQWLAHLHASAEMHGRRRRPVRISTQVQSCNYEQAQACSLNPAMVHSGAGSMFRGRTAASPPAAADACMCSTYALASRAHMSAYYSCGRSAASRQVWPACCCMPNLFSAKASSAQRHSHWLCVLVWEGRGALKRCGCRGAAVSQHTPAQQRCGVKHQQASQCPCCAGCLHHAVAKLA